MRIISAISNVIILTLLISGVAAATSIVSTFDTNLDGWSSNPQGTLAFVPAGGNSDGYLEETDASSGGNMHAVAPGKFLGDLTWADTLSVDLRAYVTPITIRPAFGTLTFLNSVAALSISLDLGDPSTAWTSYSTALNGAAFGVDGATYATVMGNVTSLTLILEADRDSDTEKAGLDNFAISGGGGLSADSVPEPAPFALVGITLVLCGVARRKLSSCA